LNKEKVRIILIIVGSIALLVIAYLYTS